jgi:Protein of unknown function (DUF3443)
MMSCGKAFFGAVWWAAVAVLLTACGGGGGAGPASSGGPALASNEHVVYVDSGPAGTGYNANRLYTDVTVCQAGNPANCQTINHVLVDTGSTGLRILSSVLNRNLGLRGLTAPSGLPALGCVQFVDNTFAWGPLAVADVTLGSKRAASLPIQVIAEPAFAALAASCSGGNNINSASTLGANGVLGIGLFKEDCGVACEVNPLNGFYYTCTDVTCTAARGTTLARTLQTQNPVGFFAADNNGLLINLPSAGSFPSASLVGTMVFGVGTQPNNQPPLGRVLATTPSGYVTTVFQGRTMARSFLDSGSNGLYVDSPSIAVCAGASGFYCPAGLTAFAATMAGSNGVTLAVTFTIDNALASFVGGNPVLPNLAGTFGDSRSFDWGLPFFYGRRVFFGLEGAASSAGTGPYYAF